LSFAGRPSRTTRGIGLGFCVTAQVVARFGPYDDLAMFSRFPPRIAN
jgi:hypothetical protein